ncbi:MAG: hypothetical protein WKG06_24785 [Segetibacter sp.]
MKILKNLFMMQVIKAFGHIDSNGSIAGIKKFAYDVCGNTINIALQKSCMPFFSKRPGMR